MLLRGHGDRTGGLEVWRSWRLLLLLSPAGWRRNHNPCCPGATMDIRMIACSYFVAICLIVTCIFTDVITRSYLLLLEFLATLIINHTIVDIVVVLCIVSYIMTTICISICSIRMNVRMYNLSPLTPAHLF